MKTSKEQMQAIYDKALAAAKDAQADYGPEDLTAFNCGFAWVTVPGNSAFGRWAKAEGLSAAGYPKGQQFWCPGGAPVQDVDIHAAGARAFCESLQADGIEAHWSMRLD